MILIEKQPYNKHENKYVGPFKIMEMNGENVTVESNENKKKITVHKNRIVKAN